MHNFNKESVLTVAVAMFVVVFALVTVYKNYESNNYLSNYSSLASYSPILQKKTEILKLVSSNTEMTPEIQEVIFDSLAGSKVFQYNFTPEEKKKIINYLNK